MRYKNKTKSIRIVFRLIVGLATILFVLSFTNALNAEDVTSHKGRFWKIKRAKCGDTLENGRFELRKNLNCDEDPAITIIGPAKLNLNGKTLSGNGDNVCIQINGEGAKVWNGTVTNCADGVVIAGTGRHKVFRIRSMDNDGIGFKVDEDSNDNWLSDNEAIGNLEENFLIEQESDGNHLINNKAEDGEDRGYYVRGSNNCLYKNKAYGNRDDALRINNGNNNRATYNIFSGTEDGEGVEIQSIENFVRNNIIKQNVRGMRIRDDHNVVKENIIISNGQEGIRVESSENLISSNFILNNGQEGIRVQESTLNIISRNLIKNNGFNESDPEDIRDGLKLEDGANETTLTRNLVFNNSGNGINVNEGAIENTIEHNIAMRNGVDDTYYDALDGNTDVDGNPNCDENNWRENYFGTKDPENCID
jgi:parallel beta-helix repeat protein